MNLLYRSSNRNGTNDHFVRIPKHRTIFRETVRHASYGCQATIVYIKHFKTKTGKYGEWPSVYRILNKHAK